MPMHDPDRIPASAARLADEIAATVRDARAGEWVEAMLLAALGEAAALERQRCTELAEQRARKWEGIRMNDPGWA